MDEEIPYADNLPYDEQLPAAPEEAASISLKERIGNRIYLLEDSRKRKLLDTGETPEDDGDAEETNADLSHRPNALLLRGPPISQLPTARVFAYATHFDAHPIGLEWVDDQTCVLVFTNRKHALQAWESLRRSPQAGDSTSAMQLETEGVEVFPAPPLPLALYPIEDRINSALGSEKSAILKETINIRWALSSDVKQQGARVNSEFYKKHGETAGKESLPGLLQNKRRRYSEGDWDTRRRLDEELDTLEEGQSTNLDERVGEKRRRPQNEEARKLLDDELDSFLAHGSESQAEALTDSHVPSLVDRTTRPLPRRARRGVANDRNESRGGVDDERWLHNAEMRRRTRWADNEEGYGMRAWREPSGRRSARSGKGGKGRKPHKTQEELDRELEEFLGE